MVTISTTFESPKAEKYSQVTKPAVKFLLIHHKLFQMGSNLKTKTKNQTPKEPLWKEKTINLLLHKQQAEHPHHLRINLHPAKGGSAHP